MLYHHATAGLHGPTITPTVKQETPRATHLWRALSLLLSPGLGRLGSLPVESSTSPSPPLATEAATAAAKAVEGEWRDRDLRPNRSQYVKRFDTFSGSTMVF